MKYSTFRGLAIGGGALFFLAGCGLLARTCGGSTSDQKTGGPVAVAEPSQGKVTTAPPVAQGPVDRAPAGSPAAASTNATQPLSAAEATSGIALRPMDSEILQRAAGSIAGDKVKDAIKGRSYKVNLYQDAGETRVNRLKIDLDRDDKFDEKWTLSPSRDDIRRQVSTTDDDKTYDEEYRLRGDKWLKK